MKINTNHDITKKNKGLDRGLEAARSSQSAQRLSHRRSDHQRQRTAGGQRGLGAEDDQTLQKRDGDDHAAHPAHSARKTTHDQTESRGRVLGDGAGGQHGGDQADRARRVGRDGRIDVLHALTRDGGGW